jgi:hypothetical protein
MSANRLSAGSAAAYVVENDQWWSPTSLDVADGVEEAMIVERRDQLLNEKRLIK